VKRLLVCVAILCVSACSTTTTTKTIEKDVQTSDVTTKFRDTLLAAAVRTKLLSEDVDSATRVQVSINAGVVTLSGRVGSATEKARVLSAARSVRGVKSVEETLTVGSVGPSVAQSVDDAGLAAKVEGAMVAQAGVNVSGVGVKAKAGIVTLTGHVPTSAIKSTMVEAAKKASGVRNVVDQIVVKP
jgi:hyperosmotically inducible periplasmic protein